MTVKIYRYFLDAKVKPECRLLLSRFQYCNTFVTNIISSLAMREIGRTSHLITPETFKESEDGVSISAVFLESGLQFHTWPEHRVFYLDIVSCKEFRPRVVRAVATAFFDISGYVEDFIEPKEIKEGV